MAAEEKAVKKIKIGVVQKYDASTKRALVSLLDNLAVGDTIIVGEKSNQFQKVTALYINYKAVSAASRGDLVWIPLIAQIGDAIYKVMEVIIYPPKIHSDKIRGDIEKELEKEIKEHVKGELQKKIKEGEGELEKKPQSDPYRLHEDKIMKRIMGEIMKEMGAEIYKRIDSEIEKRIQSDSSREIVETIVGEIGKMMVGEIQRRMGGEIERSIMGEITRINGKLKRSGGC